MKAGRSGLKRLESDDGVRVLDAGDALHLLIHEVTDVRAAVDVEFHQQIVVAGGRIDLGCNFRFGQGVGHLVGLSELAFDLNEKWGHRRAPKAYSIAWPHNPFIPAEAGIQSMIAASAVHAVGTRFRGDERRRAQCNPAKTWGAGKRARPRMTELLRRRQLLPWDRARITYL